MEHLLTSGAQAIAVPTLAASEADRRTLYLALVHDHAEGVARFLYGMVGDAELSADLSQDVFEQAWRSIGQLREPESARSWLFAIAANAARRQLRRSGRFGWLPLGILAQDGARLVSTTLRDEALDLESVLGKLSTDDRSVLLLVGERDLTLAEAAVVFGISPEAAKKRWQRACARFREAMGEG
jgi:RNA polymerase sigma-70 factor (ECF subfamily)